MNLLFLGGTQFVGRHMVEAALAEGHTVTLFNRGNTNPDLFPAAEKMRGDRDGGLERLKGRTWDAAIDVNGYVPRLVRDSAELLQDSVGQYIFVSTGSVYNFEKLPPQADETAPLETLDDETTEEYAGPAYGGLKVLCERVVSAVYGVRGLSLRLGIVAGPYDPTNRATYWVARFAQGGEILVPGGPDNAIQFIDARDLAAFSMLALRKKLSGVYNTAGQSSRWGDWLAACRQASDSQATVTWIDDEDFLQVQTQRIERRLGVFPLVVPANLNSLFTISNRRAEAEGLTYRPFSDTARDILAWAQSQPADENPETPPAGISPAEEASILAAWHAR